ncbi:YycC family protein [Paenibacillus sp. sgz500958]|uniref:YycC family protein n=1 Tax=Paenibacillus sp. sgz500958 TaxID=3242475 RepID=UPI0036D37A95
MPPLQISPETAIALSKQLGVPLEHLMHMPKHILLQKIAELSKKEENSSNADHQPSQEEKPRKEES